MRANEDVEKVGRVRGKEKEWRDGNSFLQKGLKSMCSNDDEMVKPGAGRKRYVLFW